MPSEHSATLTFDELDGLAFAGQKGRFEPAKHRFRSGPIGPIFELRLLAKAGVLPWPSNDSWLVLDGAAPMVEALGNRNRHVWVCPESKALGAFRTFQTVQDEGIAWTQFGFAAQQAATNIAGLPSTIAKQLVGALGEMQDNIYEHSQAPATGIIAFSANPGSFEFTVSDCGIGTLASLKSSPEYSMLADHGQALKLALTPGVSRFGPGRGTGFQQLFVGLANLNATLRFRSGDHAVTVAGRKPGGIPFDLSQKPPLKGFFASVLCQP